MQALRRLLDGLVDYAGLFPPAKLGMAEAVERYADSLRGSESWMLGRFVVPVNRLDEFERAAASRLPEGSDDAWEISVLTGPDPAADVREIRAFADRHGGRGVRIRSAELRASRPADIIAFLEIMPRRVELFVELPVEEDPSALVATVRRAGANAKIRTGGTTADAFPSAENVARFLVACHEHETAFKATAGLHHPIRGRYPLTYDEGSASGEMFGFLNVFLAAGFLHAGRLQPQRVVAVLEERDPAAFAFNDEEACWRDVRLSTDGLERCRREFARSYGSCSFREPVEDLKRLSLL